MGLCAYPYVNDKGLAFPCGQCKPCRIRRSQVWTFRIELEAKLWAQNAFCTLTYSDEELPPDDSLSKEDLQLFLKRLRYNFEPLRLRFFAVGEYGDVTKRPHYHLVLFNFPPCLHGRTRNRFTGEECCPCCDLVRKSWGKGEIELRWLDAGSARYVAGYVLKKMRQDTPELSARQQPEFARMSTRPGIGQGSMWDVASTVLQEHLLERMGDVPKALREGSKVRPIGPYLTRQLRKMCGEDEKAPALVLAQAEAEMLPLLTRARELAGDGPGKGERFKGVLKGLLWERDEGKVGRVSQVADLRQQKRRM